MKILGIDTSLRSTGYGLINIHEKVIKPLDCGIIKNKQSLSQLQCLHRIAAGITQLIELFKPEEVCIEGVFFHRNAQTAMILGMARGAALSAVAKFDLPVYEYSPKTAKLAVTGTGNASKEQVSYMMSQILKVDNSEINDDATDALALAYCHYHHLKNKIKFPKKL
ncbi:MAG: crossover junction endodeoxyribonuclease RuvC [Lentisphaeraceae bacterium]|nr:crossover junction endodeoxyribonuclease RuvC [Lentisphaeraceae bacterium]